MKRKNVLSKNALRKKPSYTAPRLPVKTLADPLFEYRNGRASARISRRNRSGRRAQRPAFAALQRRI
jgi:hypothetical protein